VIDTLLTIIVVGLAIAFGAFADRMLNWWGHRHEQLTGQPQYTQALSNWLKCGIDKKLFDMQFRVSDCDLGSLQQWLSDFPKAAGVATETLAPGERDRLTYWFWGVIAYLTILGTLSAKVSIAAALSPCARTSGWSCLMAGLLGSCVAAFRSCLDRRANGFEDKFGNATPDSRTAKERFSDGMTAWFVGRPLLGAAIGVMALVAIRGHALGEVIGYDKLDKNPATLIFYVWLAGLFAKTLLDLFLDLAKKIFRV
jgi:hypothetical protein